MSAWLGDTDRVEEAFSKLARLQPDNARVTIGWAQYLRQEGDVRKSSMILEEASLDPAMHPDAAMLEAENRLAENQFQSALDKIALIPSEKRADPAIASRWSRLQNKANAFATNWVKEQEWRSEEAQADDLPRVLVTTSRGPFTLELFENQAPTTVGHFVSLVEEDAYDQTLFRMPPNAAFNRSIAANMIFGGDPNTHPDASGRPGDGSVGYRIPDENLRDDSRKNFAGVIGVVKRPLPNAPGMTSPNSGGAEFYLTRMPMETLDTEHTVFGRVIDGMIVVRNLAPDDTIVSMEVIRKRDHEYAASKLPEIPELAPPAVEEESAETSEEQATP
ncbi:MAG: hypothetical protein CMJ32_12105 [Phycisphaerae bacterium]|nr:hypothetical protein [Phycisphaerae bacterium]